MKPLLFLTYRSMVNGLRRAISSPKRILSLALIVAYYFWFFIRPGLVASRQADLGPVSQQLGQFSPELVDAVMFGAFAAMSVLLAFGIFATKGGFKPADVDVLFPTPISPKLVLGFRILREYLGTLIFPLLMVLLMLPASRRGWSSLFRNAQAGDSELAMRSMSLAWILMALCWVAIAYAAGLFVNRSDLQSDRNKKIIAWGMGLLALAVSVFLYAKFARVQSLQDAVAIAQNPFLRVVFFTATAATHIAMAPLTGNAAGALLGAGMMVGIIALAMWAAMTQANWMYDQAAAKGFRSSELRERRAQGDMVGEAVSRAQSGKARRYRKRWLHRVPACGVKALVWKEVFIQTRSAGALLVAMAIPGVAFGLVPVLALRDGTRAAPYMFLGFQAMLVFMVTMNVAMAGYIEVLRRVDLQKPLPFPPFATVLAEVVSKAFWGVALSVFSCALTVALEPGWWAFALAALAFNPGLSVVMSAAVFLITVLFPDEDDPGQRQFHRLVMLLAVVISAAPGFGIAVGGLLVPAFRELPFIPAAVGGAVHLGLAAALAYPASLLYATYNPSE